MNVGDLVKITKEFGGHWLDCGDVEFNCAGMTGIFLGFNKRIPNTNAPPIPVHTATIWFFNGYICEIDVPHVWVGVISESR